MHIARYASSYKHLILSHLRLSLQSLMHEMGSTQECQNQFALIDLSKNVIILKKDQSVTIYPSSICDTFIQCPKPPNFAE